ncbi:hypothetical protein chiPu_0026886 [Chiloscyllium punctatum]|uniref:Uncharacterized protein n=2 Tax=Chiloscyllium punctatum TaxID=137246 RepID=A0A401TJ92_CHIPU|nr:hypothetical protein [Chiloscyllium punctatum]
MEKKGNVEDPVSEESEESQREDKSEPCHGPENQSFKHRVILCADRVFLCFLVLLFVVLMLEVIYKIWYITKWRAVFNFLRDLASYLTEQPEEEEMIEL